MPNTWGTWNTGSEVWEAEVSMETNFSADVQIPLIPPRQSLTWLGTLSLSCTAWALAHVSSEQTTGSSHSFPAQGGCCSDEIMDPAPDTVLGDKRVTFPQGFSSHVALLAIPSHLALLLKLHPFPKLHHFHPSWVWANPSQAQLAWINQAVPVRSNIAGIRWAKMGRKQCSGAQHTSHKFK